MTTLVFTTVVISGVKITIDAHAAGEICTVDNPFEVSNITAKDVYTVNACYATFAAAQSALNTLSATQPNVVIRHSLSFSPSKIIAMDRGIAVTYDSRTDATSTINLYASYNAATLTPLTALTYMTNHYDMQYLGTMGYNAATGNGIIRIKVSGFTGYIDLKNSDLIPMIYLDNAWSFTLGGTPAGSAYPEAPFTMVPKMNQYNAFTATYTDSTQTTRTSRDLSHEYYSQLTGARSSFTYGPAPEWLPNGSYYSWDGITFYYDRDCKLPVYNGDVIGRYYQYFQYLPLRSDSNYTAAEIDAYVVALGFTKKPTPTSLSGSMLFGEGASFIASQTLYGMNALQVFALAYHESGGGTSSLAINHFNLFGWGAVDSNPDQAAVFTSIAQSIDEMMGINLRGYISPENWRFFGSVFGSKNSGMNVKYASDLFWGEKIAGRAYTMDRWLGSKDYGIVDFAIINNGTSVSVEKTEGTDTTDLYTLSNGLKDESIIVKSSNRIAGRLWTATPTTMPLDASRNTILFNSTATQLIQYNRDLSVAYLNNYTLPYMVPKMVDGHARTLVQAMAWNGNKLSITGYGFFNGYNEPNLANVNHALRLILDGQSTTYTLDDGMSGEQITTDFANGKLSYDGTTFNSSSIDLSQLAVGSYTLGIALSQPRYGISGDLIFNYTDTLPADQVINGKFFKFERLVSGEIRLNVSYAILFAPYTTTPTNQDITVNASVSNMTLNQGSYTFTQNGSFTFIATDGTNTVERIVTIDNIDKVPPIIAIEPYSLEMLDTSLMVNASTNEGTLNFTSHTFQNNGSFDFVATDAAGNITTKNVTITNINPRYSVDYAVSSGQGTLSALVGTSPLANGDYLTPGNIAIFDVVPNAGYLVTQWTVDGAPVPNNLTNALSATITATTIVRVRLTMFGDVNDDNRLTTSDIVILRRYLAGLTNLSDLNKLSGDYNRDGKITTTDIVMMRRKLAGLE
jgi:beta-N-acetylglucosaminidase